MHPSYDPHVREHMSHANNPFLGSISMQLVVWLNLKGLEYTLVRI